jgi:hypothetical protein
LYGEGEAFQRWILDLENTGIEAIVVLREEDKYRATRKSTIGRRAQSGSTDLSSTPNIACRGIEDVEILPKQDMK